MHLKLKSGNIELSSDENSEIEAIFKEEMRFRGRQKSEEKKKKRQMTKKAKHMLKMVIGTILRHEFQIFSGNLKILSP